MKIINTAFEEVKIIEPRLFKDKRGGFFEVFHEQKFQDKLKTNLSFVQDNFSYSEKNVLRGLHFQQRFAQGKLVRVSYGAVYDVVVDIRLNSNTFGSWYGVELSGINHKQMWIPPGFAHGFYVLTERAHLDYKCTDFYHPEDEICIKWDDPDIGVIWPENKKIVSDKDDRGILLKDFLTT
jgi:dTDP-4-dehydrorhamnose 3,5-epimerase